MSQNTLRAVGFMEIAMESIILIKIKVRYIVLSKNLLLETRIKTESTTTTLKSTICQNNSQKTTIKVGARIF